MVHERMPRVHFIGELKYLLGPNETTQDVQSAFINFIGSKLLKNMLNGEHYPYMPKFLFGWNKRWCGPADPKFDIKYVEEEICEGDIVFLLNPLVHLRGSGKKRFAPVLIAARKKIGHKGHVFFAFSDKDLYSYEREGQLFPMLSYPRDIVCPKTECHEAQDRLLGDLMDLISGKFIERLSLQET